MVKMMKKALVKDNVHLRSLKNNQIVSKRNKVISKSKSILVKSFNKIQLFVAKVVEMLNKKTVQKIFMIS